MFLCSLFTIDVTTGEIFRPLNTSSLTEKTYNLIVIVQDISDVHQQSFAKVIITNNLYSYNSLGQTNTAVYSEISTKPSIDMVSHSEKLIVNAFTTYRQQYEFSTTSLPNCNFSTEKKIFMLEEYDFIVLQTNNSIGILQVT